jgi:hypothetical protein
VEDSLAHGPIAIQKLIFDRNGTVFGLWLEIDHGPLSKDGDEIEALSAATSDRTSNTLHLTIAAQNGFAAIYSNDHHLLAAACLDLKRRT